EEHNRQDIAYVYPGYAPLSVRLIQCATTKSGIPSTGNGWKGYEEVLRMLPGKTFDEVQRQEEGAIRPKSNLLFIGLGMIQGQHPRVTLVFFLGGCTYTEISAIRFLAQQDD
ncbi:15117_t:CDS:2, partial [Cetraspora pellucida]